MRIATVGRLVIAGVTVILLALTVVSSGPPTLAAEGASFAYTGDIGPYFWADLNSDWTACAGAGSRQSPIDITRAEPDRRLQPLRTDYHATPISLVNNGHTVEQEYEEGSALIFDGVVYDLLQFHYHTLSEHTIGGTQYPMELHAVHEDLATGNLAVIGMLFTLGNENTFLEQFGQLPTHNGDHVNSNTTINLEDALVTTAGYYTYPGSLTTPPCSEIVTWIVLSDVAEMSWQQFQRYRRIVGNNFRPLQPRPETFAVRQR